MAPKRPSSTPGVRQSKAKRPRLTEGLLERVSETSLDVLLEVSTIRLRHGVFDIDDQLQIFSHLEPRDFLHLCRTNKSLRSILLDRNALSVWRSARRSLKGLPDLPEDLSEPRYASLLFDKYCQFCLHATSLVQWASRTRCCRHCLKNTEIFSPTLDRQLTFSPTLLRHWQDRLQSIRIIRIIPFFIYDCMTYYHVPSMKVLDEEAKDMLNDETSFNDWRERKKARLAAIEARGDACDTWLAKRLEARKGELSAIRRKRLKAVIERLKALGWEDLIYRVPWKKIAAHKLVAQSKPLTERAWRKMEPVMVEFMKELQLKNKRGGTMCDGYEDRGFVNYEFWTLDGERNQFGPFDPETGKYANTWLTDLSLGIAFDQY
ncbi:hypothetical protein EV421DRAFT_106284 [Armillaria borealis]|uniref:F-box domain-containing protein n=1 Tax=Armillaria borealis TaxID=47425 RepID=A0AA39JS82_9AGAR|nr:hypothetical protein EV421DRAFT_106284 [Armillaria borealis]